VTASLAAIRHRATRPDAPSWSSGLRTPRPPWLRTCVWIIVVRTSRWPSSSWMVLMPYPACR